MSAIRFPIFVALCTSAFSYAQAPPQSDSALPTEATTPVSTPATSPQQRTAPVQEYAPPKDVRTNVLGADRNTRSVPTNTREMPPAADLISTEGLGRYSNGYLP